MTTFIQTLTSYVPSLIVGRLAADPSPITSPVSERFSAAVLFADISGFTALTERLARRGPVGTEVLTRELNTYFGQLIDIIASYGGDVVKFAGDALIAIWPVETDDGAALTRVTRQAAACSLAIQSALRDYKTVAGLGLTLKIGLGAGELTALHIGGVYGRWEFIITGPTLAQVNQAEEQAEPGQVILSSEAWDLLHPQASGQRVAEDQVRLTAVSNVGPIPQPPPPNPSEPLASSLRPYIPGAILSRLAAGQGGWLAELRRVTIIFANLPDLSFNTPVEQAQAVMRALQTAVYRYEGSVNKLSVDDKGSTLIAALGLPPLAHEDDAVRGVQVALAMQAALREMGWRSAIGVTTGRAFCGSVGSDRRREYTMIGDVVNLAARLMQAAKGPVEARKSNPSLLCDQPTYQAARSQINFEPLSAIRVKGKTDPIPIYRPQGPKKTNLRPHRSLVGRTTEKGILIDAIQATLRGNTGRVITIKGEAGIGKSELVGILPEHARSSGVTCLVGAGDAIEKSTPYHAWRPVFSQLFQLDALPDDDELHRQQVMAQLEPDPEAVRLAPLLNAVLPLDWPDNDLTEQMTGQVRADNIHDLIVRLLSTLPTRQAEATARADGLPLPELNGNTTASLVLILEDVHWFDSASWSLTHRVCRDVRPLLVIVTARPMSASAPAYEAYQQLLKLPDVQELQLEPLSFEETQALAQQRLGVNSLPRAVADFIYQKTEGHPFLTEELAYALRDTGHIRIDDETCRIAQDAGDLTAVDFPDTIEGLITGRLDRLPPPQQLVVKVASVIGRAFAFRTLRGIHPIEADKPRLLDYLSTLEELDIMALTHPEPDLAYLFKQIIIQEVAYNLMLFAQRRQLHHEVAEWYQQSETADLDGHYPLLAHHWEQADELGLAITYLEKAGEQALLNYANEEAVTFFRRALELDDRQAGLDKSKSVGPSPNESVRQNQPLPSLAAGSPVYNQSNELRRARWELGLGEAYVNWAKFGEGRHHLETGLALMGRPIPASDAGLVVALIRQLGRQLRHRLWSTRNMERSPTTQETLLEAARAYEGLTSVYYFANEMLRSLYAAFYALNLSEAAGPPTPELARSYASVGAIMGFVPLHKLAEAYCRRALETVKQVNNLSAQAWVSLATGVYYAGVGQWARTRALLGDVMEISEHLGDRRRWDDGVGNLLTVHHFQGEFEQSLKLSGELYASAGRRTDPHNQAWALRGKIYNLLPQGKIDEASRDLEELERLLREDTGIVDEALKIDFHGLSAVMHLHRGEFRPGAEAAEQALHLMAQSSPTSYLSLPGYAGPAQFYLAAWEATLTPERILPVIGASGFRGGRLPLAVDNGPSLAQAACRALRRFARVFPVGRPRAWLWQGLYDWLSGRSGKAHKAWQKSLAAAERLAMPYEQGLAHYEIGRHLPEGDRAREYHLAEARRLFAHVGATGDLAYVQGVLKTPVPV